MSGAIGAQEDIYGNFSGTGRQFMGTAQISSNDFGIAVSSDDAEEDASSSEESEPEPEPEKVLPPPARPQGGKQRSAYSTNVAPSLEEKQRLMHEAMGTMGRPKKSPGKTAGGGGKKPAGLHLAAAPPSMQEKQRLMKQASGTLPRSKPAAAEFRPSSKAFGLPSTDPGDGPAPAAPPRPSQRKGKPKWLKQALGRDQADALVQEMTSGEFVIRASTRSGFTLVVKDNDSVLNLPITKRDNGRGGFFYHFGGKDYNALPELVVDLSPGGTNHMRSNVTHERLVLVVDGPSSRPVKSISPPKVLPDHDEGGDDDAYEVPVSQAQLRGARAAVPSVPRRNPAAPPVTSPTPMGFQPRRTDSENRAIRQSAWYCDTSQSTAKVVVGKGVSGTFLVRDSKNKQTGVVEKHVLVINDHGKIVSFQIRIQGGKYLFANRNFSSIDQVVENLRANAVKGANGQPLRPTDPANGCHFHNAAASRIAQGRAIHDRLSEHAWWTPGGKDACQKLVRQSGANGRFLVFAGKSGAVSVITRKDANSVKTYDVAFKGGQYDYMGTRRNEVAEIIDWMRGPDAKLAVALTSPAPGGVLHSTVFHVLPAAAAIPQRQQGGSPSRVQGRTLMLDGFVDSQSTIDDTRSAAVGPARARNSADGWRGSAAAPAPGRPASRVMNLGGMEHLESSSDDHEFTAMEARATRLRAKKAAQEQAAAQSRPPPAKPVAKQTHDWDDGFGDSDDEFDC